LSELFYLRCAELLGVEYDCQPFEYYRRNRWNNRSPGNGRYPGYGIIRKFGDRIQVALHHPIEHYKIYDNEQEVLTFLANLEKTY
jgi:hypothetical protein